MNLYWIIGLKMFINQSLDIKVNRLPPPPLYITKGVGVAIY